MLQASQLSIGPSCPASQLFTCRRTTGQRLAPVGRQTGRREGQRASESKPSFWPQPKVSARNGLINILMGAATRSPAAQWSPAVQCSSALEVERASCPLAGCLAARLPVRGQRMGSGWASTSGQERAWWPHKSATLALGDSRRRFGRLSGASSHDELPLSSLPSGRRRENMEKMAPLL